MDLVLKFHRIYVDILEEILNIKKKSINIYIATYISPHIKSYFFDIRNIFLLDSKGIFASLPVSRRNTEVLSV